MKKVKENKVTKFKAKNSNGHDMAAINKMKERYYRLPSQTGYPRFIDSVTGVQQGDKDYLLNYYKGCLEGRVDSDDMPDSAYLAGCLDFVSGLGFEPNGGRISGGKLNLWNEPELVPRKDIRGGLDESAALFLELLARWFPDVEERNYFQWWVAHTILVPQERKVATVLLRSEHGTGKGFLAEDLMPNLMGKDSVVVCALPDVIGTFNGLMKGKTLVMIDEVYANRSKVINSLKSIQGNNTFQINEKYESALTVKNYLNFMITSNDHLPLNLEKGDRRYWVPNFITHKVSVAETAEFINVKLKPWLKGGGYQIVLDYLYYCVDLKEYSPNSAPPVTEGKLELMGHSALDRLEEKVGEVIKDRPVVSAAGLKVEFTGGDVGDITTRSVANALLSAGCKQKRTSDTRYYITPFGMRDGLGLDTPPRVLKERCVSILN